MDLFCNVEIDGCRIGVILQNQTKIHYAMPIRAMNEEAEAYYSQWKGLEKEHREKEFKGWGRISVRYEQE